jgi:hypothetical protein
VDTDENGDAPFEFTVSASLSNQNITATATDEATGDTSEFCQAAGGLRITEIKRAGADIHVSFTTDAGRSYRLERQSSLDPTAAWPTVPGAENVPGNGSVVTVTDSGAANSAMYYYRVQLLP